MAGACVGKTWRLELATGWLIGVFSMWLFQVAWPGAKHGRFRTVFYGGRLKFPSVTAPANKMMVALMTKPWKPQSLTPTMFFWSSSPKPIQAEGEEN